MSQRDKYDAEPLCRNQMKKTRIGHEAELTHPQTVKYLGELVDLGLLTLTDFKSFSYYEITKNVCRCLKIFGEIADGLRSEFGD